MDGLLWVVPVLGIVALAFAGYLAARVNKQDPGTERMKERTAREERGERGNWVPKGTGLKRNHKDPPHPQQTQAGRRAFLVWPYWPAVSVQRSPHSPAEMQLGLLCLWT